MRIRDLLTAGVVGILITACAGMQGGASSDTRAAVAPTGRLRVAVLLGMTTTKDAATGELKGVPLDLAKELARRLGVPFDPVVYPASPALIGGAKSGEWDIALIGINAERAAAMDFSEPYIEIEQGYLVRAGVPIATASDVDKAGIRVGVVEKASADVLLSRALKRATLVRTKSVAELHGLFGPGKADVIAAGKPLLFAEAARQPGTRVLDGRILVEPIGMGVPKGRNPAAASYVGKFVEDAKAEGLVKSAIERAELRGVVVTPRN